MKNEIPVISKYQHGELGINIQNSRKNKNIKAIELSRMVGITRSYLSKIENGFREPTLAVLFDIAVALDVTVDDLMGINKKKDDYKNQLEKENAQLKEHIRTITYQMIQNVGTGLSLISED